MMMNVGNPDEAFALSFIPNDGVGLARDGIHHQRPTSRSIRWPAGYDASTTAARKREIDRLTAGYADKPQFFVDSWPKESR